MTFGIVVAISMPVYIVEPDIQSKSKIISIPQCIELCLELVQCCGSSILCCECGKTQQIFSSLTHPRHVPQRNNGLLLSLAVATS